MSTPAMISVKTHTTRNSPTVGHICENILSENRIQAWHYEARMKCRMAECFIATIVGSCRSHFAKCRAIPFEQTRTPIVPAGNYWRTGTRPSAHTPLPRLTPVLLQLLTAITFFVSRFLIFSLPGASHCNRRKARKSAGIATDPLFVANETMGQVANWAGLETETVFTRE